MTAVDLDALGHVVVGTTTLPFDAFLRYCADPRDVPDDVPAAALDVLRTRFIDAGRAALHALDERERWSQLDVRLAHGATSATGIVAACAAAEELLRTGDVGDFFFMRKPPGLRLRYRLHDKGTDVLGGLARALAEDGHVGSVGYGVYEPEALLFGGPASMAHVHRWFTIDSLAWGRYFAQDAAERAPVWQVSSALLRPLVAALGVADAEDLDVWERVRTGFGRRLPDLGADDELGAARAELVQEWYASTLDAATADRLGLGPYRAAVATIGSEWRGSYFGTGTATIGPREALALCTIFHWNRGGLSPELQAILTTALADRSRI